LEIRSPLKALIKLIHNGKCVKEIIGDEFIEPILETEFIGPSFIGKAEVGYIQITSG